MRSDDVDPVDPVDPAAFADLPSTDVGVDLHVHFGMAGSFPLRLAEVFFADDGGVYVAEYAYITPMFGLGMRRHTKEAAGMLQVYEIHGVDEVLLQADKVVWTAYANLDRVRLDDGGLTGRPKLTLYLADGHSYAYRLHEGADATSLAGDLAELATRHEFAFEHDSGLGFRPRENVRRFFIS